MTPRDMRKPGRPKTIWRQTDLADLSEVKLTWGEALHVAQNRDKWREIFVSLCPTGDEEDKVSSKLGRIISIRAKHA